jgi:hypothetical protein
MILEASVGMFFYINFYRPYIPVNKKIKLEMALDTVRNTYRESFKAQKHSKPWFLVFTRAARWYIFKPKNPIWVNFGGSCNGRCWSILWTFGKFYGHLVNFTSIW